MKRLKLFLPILITFTFQACIKQLDYVVDDVPTKLVVNSILQDGKQIKLKLGFLQSILDTSKCFINDAIVIITEDDTRIDTLYSMENGEYRSFLSARAGSKYTLEVYAEGFPSVYACDTVPLPVSINKASYQKGVNHNEFGDELEDYSIEITDPEGSNFFELLLIYQYKLSDEKFEINFPATIYKNDPVITSEGLDDFGGLSLLFSDNLIEGITYEFNIQTEFASSGVFEEPFLNTYNRNVRFVLLRTVSGAYMNYKRSWLKHSYNKADAYKVEEPYFLPLAGEPAEMYSNIEGGFGIFVAYSQSSFILESR